MKKIQPLPYRPRAIHPVGRFGAMKAFVIKTAERLVGRQISRGASFLPARQVSESQQETETAESIHEVRVAYEGREYYFSIDGFYCRRKPG